MNAGLLKKRVKECLWQLVDHEDAIVSATLTGSFLNANSLDGLSDIDFVVIVDGLNAMSYDRILTMFQNGLEPVLREWGYSLLINPTLGPLKFNEEKLAVLHLMMYSPHAHVEHVINSPFTCLDWQQTGEYHKRSLAECYPAFRLQPRHFLSARRGISEYLNDYRSRTVSYRELCCDSVGYQEVKRTKPMNERDRHEFAYHVMRFLMRNLLKLVEGDQASVRSNEQLLKDFHRWFPKDADDHARLFLELAHRKTACDFETPIDCLDARLESFVIAFEKQFRSEFEEGAVPHVAFRHAPTALHSGEVRFIGRVDPAVDSLELIRESAWKDQMAFAPSRFISSPLLRCRQTLLATFPELESSAIRIDDRIIEIDYGDCDGLTLTQARSDFPAMFEAWADGQDPAFPNGESTHEVLARAKSFVEQQWATDQPPSAVCTHNVVLRCLVGHSLGVDSAQWHRIRIPFLTPISFVSTKRFGLFVNLTPPLEREMFRDFQFESEVAPCKS